MTRTLFGGVTTKRVVTVYDIVTTVFVAIYVVDGQHAAQLTTSSLVTNTHAKTHRENGLRSFQRVWRGSIDQHSSTAANLDHCRASPHPGYPTTPSLLPARIIFARARGARSCAQSGRSSSNLRHTCRSKLQRMQQCTRRVQEQWAVPACGLG